ncbi:transcriptional regulator, TetR family [Desulfatibacillum alkenivorans DSM 16219]|jgi:AcrR family transcriptional regulator|uniref:Transcriptional regulator, TetR family n=1 Tax=Desulfatibacillum alkenivorans DSM 16219 TaxID=1121393 RepID=A0A1M6S5F0_9BACT|nr:helix-turn-helix domain-containing protein [Desulfatibacillum alkenivorans]SHK40002.1 transcriptional regulator, TetR family [Desulfatibacillum alkenivorans DSM 16219]
MTTSPVRPYLGKPAEERIQERRRLLMDTAFELLASDGWRQTTIDKICRKAKLNKRYFYESFPGLDELAAAVVDELAQALLEHGFRAVQEAREEGLSTDDLARKAIAAVVEYVTEDSRRARVLFTEAAATPQAMAHRKATIHGLAKALSAYGLEHHNAQGEEDPLDILASALLIGGSMEAVLTWLDGNIAMSREQFIDDLAALWVFAGDGAAARAKARRSSVVNKVTTA